MGEIGKIAAGMGILIAIYLFVRNSEGATSVISTLGGAIAKNVSTLQGNG